jgi:4'-phosphopantetheinyl transferase
MDAFERARWRRYRQPRDRDRFAAGAMLLRQSASYLTGLTEADLRVDRSCACGLQHGRPQLVGTGLTASVSHSGDRAVVALMQDGRVGVDVECLGRTRWADVTSHVRAVSEPEPRTHSDFLRSWVRKEAVVKALGTGLRTDPRLVDVAPHSGFATLGGEQEGMTLHDLTLGHGYLGCIAVQSQTPYALDITEVNLTTAGRIQPKAFTSRVDGADPGQPPRAASTPS